MTGLKTSIGHEVRMIWMVVRIHMIKMAQDVMDLKNRILNSKPSDVEDESPTLPAVLEKMVDLQASSALLSLDICLLIMMTEEIILPSIWTSEF